MGLKTNPMAPNTEAGTALIAGTVEVGGTGITVRMQETDTGETGVTVHLVTSRLHFDGRHQRGSFTVWLIDLGTPCSRSS